ncbi:hypothetical protein J6590_020266 [Homalodisca vitripennis]|nr:hypothetical protein J6590_020266 [Homalodisca vitripennis]
MTAIKLDFWHGTNNGLYSCPGALRIWSWSRLTGKSGLRRDGPSPRRGTRLGDNTLTQPRALDKQSYDASSQSTCLFLSNSSALHFDLIMKIDQSTPASSPGERSSPAHVCSGREQTSCNQDSNIDEPCSELALRRCFWNIQPSDCRLLVLKLHFPAAFPSV